MFKKRLSFLILLIFCFSNFSISPYFHINNYSKNSREFSLFDLVYSDYDSMDSDDSSEQSKKGTKKEFNAKDYTDAYKKAVNDIYDQFEKAYRRNQEIINRSSGLINQTGYQRLLDQQVKSENLFTKAFKAAKITKNGDELVFPEFNFVEVTNAVEIFMF